MSHAAQGEAACDHAEAIARRDLNNLYLTSRFFADRRRYRAFCAFYSVMRVVDDRVDDLSARRPVPPEELARAEREVAAWRSAIRRLYAGAPPEPDPVLGEDGILLVAFRDALARFPVPEILWERFFDAMARDLREPRFATFADFLAYAEGATVAPTTIYLALLGSRGGEEGDGRYLVPEEFELLACGRNLGLFAYLVHILRDLPKDLEAGESGLIYLAADDMAAFGVSDATLAAAAASGRASEELRALLAELGRRAREFLDAGRALLAPLAGRLTPDCEFVLGLIVGMYEELLRRIAEQRFDPFPGRHRLSLNDKRKLVVATARRADFPLDLKTLAGAFGL